MNTSVAGIDVGARSLHLAVHTPTQSFNVTCFPNTPEGMASLCDMLHQHQVRRVVLEATGIYHLDLALRLDADPSLQVMVLNPKAAHAYAQARMTRHKTDAIDAALLADYARQMPFEAWRAPAAGALAIRACSRRLAALTQQRTRAKNQLHALARTRSTPDFLLEDVRLSIAQLDARISDLQSRTLAMIQQDPAMSHILALLTSIKGFAEKSALQLMGELLVLPQDMRDKQWVAMAGLDPRQHQSGTSVAKQTRISKRGNRYLRMALFMPALCATQHEPHVKAYYRHLIEVRGLKKMQALCAVKRKFLHAIHAMLRHDEPFDPTRFYAMPQGKGD